MWIPSRKSVLLVCSINHRLPIGLYLVLCMTPPPGTPPLLTLPMHKSIWPNLLLDQPLTQLPQGSPERRIACLTTFFAKLTLYITLLISLLFMNQLLGVQEILPIENQSEHWTALCGNFQRIPSRSSVQAYPASWTSSEAKDIAG